MGNQDPMLILKQNVEAFIQSKLPSCLHISIDDELGPLPFTRLPCARHEHKTFVCCLMSSL